jgi:zinc and cadmium transporter
MSKAKALMFNFFSALVAVLGGIISLTLGAYIHNYEMILLPITAGGFIYIAGSDLIPEMHKECNNTKALIQFIGIALGVAVMVLLLKLG